MRLSLSLALALLLFTGPARADGPGFDLSEVGKLDVHRPPPEYEVIREPVNGATRLSLAFPHGGRVELGAIDEVVIAGETVERGVIESTIQLGWLAGAPDFLLIAWSDDSSAYGTGQYLQRGTILARYTRQGIEPLLRHQTITRGRMQHLAHPAGGVRAHHYDWDRDREMLIDRLSRHVEISSSDPASPLHHPRVDESGERIFVAAIHDAFIHAHTYRDGRLTSSSIQLVYQAQEGDQLRDIARFYLGPFASAQVIAQANPELVEHLQQNREETYPQLKAGTPVVVPVPGEWLMQFVGR